MQPAPDSLPTTAAGGDPAVVPDVAGLRRDYASAGLAEASLAATWVEQFTRWIDDALAAGLAEPNAMVLGTVDGSGVPTARTVLLKGYDESGFVFYSNRSSAKGQALAANPLASLVFPWIALERQVCVSGRVTLVDDAASDGYFASRPRGSQLGAWASAQSAAVASRDELEAALADAASRFDGGPVPRPAYWGGYRLSPDYVEFWQGRTSRLHDRLRFTRGAAGFEVERLAP